MKSFLMAPGGLQVRPPFSTLFPIDAAIRAGIRDDPRDGMRAAGFDPSKGIDVWDDGGVAVVVDGHTRLSVALELGIERVPVNVHDFPDERSALAYAIHQQARRRNLTQADFVRLTDFWDRYLKRPEGAPKGNSNAAKTTVSTETVVPKASSAEVIGEMLGTSRATVNRARLVNRDPVAREEFEKGASLARAEQVSIAAKREKRDDGAGLVRGPWADPAPSEPTPQSRARSNGSVCRSATQRSLSEVKAELAKASTNGLDIAGLCRRHKDVMSHWSDAKEAAYETYKLLREALSGDGAEEAVS